MVQRDDLMRRYLLTLMAYASFGIGAGSLIFFGIFIFLGSFSLMDAGLSYAGSLLVDACLSVFFFIQHSAMIRRGFRSWIEKFVAEECYPALYSIASGIALALVIGLWQKVPHVVVETSGAPYWMLRVLIFVSLAGFFWGARSLRRFDPFGVKKIMALIRGRQSGEVPLMVHGAYRWMRHPLYFFCLLIIWVCPVVSMDRLLFNILWSGWIVAGTLLEERDLVHDFGEQYRRYQSRVPMLVPYRLPDR